jgi:GNAT superfamily N-acetyltransferase
MFIIINAAAIVYKETIPSDRWKEPYMAEDELRQEIETGVVFWCLEETGAIHGIMGIQDVKDLGSKLLKHLAKQTKRPLLIGTWADAKWAITFYEKLGFILVTETEKNILLRKYWNIPERQIETSVVLSNIPVKQLVRD